MRDVLISFDFSKTDATSSGEQPLKVRLEYARIFRNSPSAPSRGFQVKIARPNTQSVGVVVHAPHSMSTPLMTPSLPGREVMRTRPWLVSMTAPFTRMFRRT